MAQFLFDWAGAPEAQLRPALEGRRLASVTVSCVRIRKMGVAGVDRWHASFARRTSDTWVGSPAREIPVCAFLPTSEITEQRAA